MHMLVHGSMAEACCNKLTTLRAMQLKGQPRIQL